MARRFRRENFLFPQNLRPNRFDPKARTVDAFQQASEGTLIQAPQRPYEIQRPDRSNSLLQLAESLTGVQRTFDQVGAKQFEDFTQRAEAEGAKLASELDLQGNKDNWKQYISTTRQTAGEDVARDLLKLNPHVQKGFDNVRARNAALNYNAALQREFTKNPLLDEESGVRLHDVDVESDLYQNWVAGFNQQFNTVNGLDTIDERALANVIPAQQDANNRVGQAQAELRSSRRLNDYENETAEFVNNVVYDLNSNEAFIQGRDNDAALLAANLITQQLDEANSLGFGGDDLNAVYTSTIAMLVSAATTTGNPALLDAAEFIEVGPTSSRQMLLDTKNGARFRDTIAQARDNISNKEWQDWQRSNAMEDREREEGKRDVYTGIADAARIYEQMGKSPQAQEMLLTALENGRVTASEQGWSAEYDATVNDIQQNAVDNIGITAQDHAAIASLEADIISGNVSGTAAIQRILELESQGLLGNAEQAAGNILRLQGKVKAGDDQVYAGFESRISRASSEVSSAISARYGVLKNEQGQITSVRQELKGAGFSDSDIARFQSMSSDDISAYATSRAEAGNPLTSSQLQAVNLVSTGEIDPFADEVQFDDADIIAQTTEFENRLYRGFEEFEQAEGRQMTPQEQADYINQEVDGFLQGNSPVSFISNSSSTSRQQQSENIVRNIYFDGVEDVDSDPNTTAVLTNGQIIEAMDYYFDNGQHHPAIKELAQANNLTPQRLIMRQSSLNNVDFDSELYSTLGVPLGDTTFTAGARNYSSLAVDITENYVEGDYKVYKTDWVDNNQPYAYDFALVQNDQDYVNVPSPANGVVTDVGNDPGGYGNWIEIEDSSTGIRYFVAHLQSSYLQKGSSVTKGQAFGQQGSTGSSTGPHIHLEFYNRQGQRIDDRRITEPIAQAWLNDIESGFFLPSQQSSTTASNTGSSSVSNLERQAYDFYRSQGWSHEASAIALGNIKQESAFETRWGQGGEFPGGDGGVAHGIFQWHSDRRPADLSSWSFEEQLKYSVEELSSNNGGGQEFADAMRSNDIPRIQRAFRNAIRWGHEGDRFAYGNEYMEMFK